MSDSASLSASATPGQEGSEPRTLSLPILCLIAVAIGVVAALGALVFRMMISLVHNLAYLGIFSLEYDAEQFNPYNPWGMGVIFVPVIGGLIVVWLVKTFAPEAKGHGVPEVMYAIYHNNGNVRGIVAIIKAVASAISIGTGASVGREGPIIQIGASFGSALARKLSLPRWQKITLLSAGAGAGIAATFNTPLGGVMFATELLLPEVSNRTFLPVVIATSTSTFIGYMMFGLDPAFMIPAQVLSSTGALNVFDLASFAVLGVVAGVASWAFVRGLAYAEDFFPKLPVNEYVQNMIGMFAVGLLSYAFLLTTGHLHVASVGYATIQSILDGGTTGLLLLAALVVGKLLATSLSLGAGASGGVFSPSLFIGAGVGGAVGILANTLIPGVEVSVIEFAVVGMGALVGGATGGSLTAIVMIFEMTRDYGIIVPLVLAVAISVGVRRALVPENIYTIKLRHRGRPIPTNRNTNMYLVRPAKEVMNTAFIALPADTPLADAVARMHEERSDHVMVTDEGRIIGFARLNKVYVPRPDASQTLRSVMADDFVIVTEANILNTVISRMNQRARSLAIVVAGGRGVPRPDDVRGIIDAPELAGAVVENHYS